MFDTLLWYRDNFIIQHAYQLGKSYETALHHHVIKIKEGFSKQEIVLGEFFDIEGASENTFL